MGEDNGTEITRLLQAWNGGDRAALGRLVELAYPELREIAARYFRGERRDHTLQCTALINEAYLRLAGAEAKVWKDRPHFFGFAARLMRGILVDHARAKNTGKRGAGALTVALNEADAPTPGPDAGILALHEALDDLEKLDPLQSRVVELRYFGGLSLEETAEVTGFSVTTIKREWIIAKTWIRRRLQ
jgi:RNA polymerase sigma factor (TIGR02999 family)